MNGEALLWRTTVYEDPGKARRGFLGRFIGTRDVGPPLKSAGLRLQKDIKMADAYMASTVVSRRVDFYRDRHEAGD